MSSAGSRFSSKEFVAMEENSATKQASGMQSESSPSEEAARQLVMEAVQRAARAEEKEAIDGWDDDDGLSDLSTVGTAPEMVRLGRGDPPTRSEEGSLGMNWSVRGSEASSPEGSVRGMSPDGQSVSGQSVYWGTTTGTGSAGLTSEEESASEGEEEAPMQVLVPGMEFNGPREVVLRTLPDIVVPSPHAFVKYYDVGFQLEAAADPKAHVFQRLKQFMEAIFDADDTANFYVVDNDEREEDRLAISELIYQKWLEKPKLSFWRKYFFRIGPRLRAGCRKVFFLMGHDVPFEDLKADCLAVWGNCWCFEKAMQYSKSVEVGWAFRSHRNMDLKDMAKEIERWCGFPVGLCWKGVLPYDKNHNHNAVHFDVMAEDAEHDRMELCSLYVAGKTCFTGDWPMHMNLRFVPTIENASPDAEATVHEMRSRQRMFTEGVSHWMSTDFEKMDEMDETLQCTLRDYIMAIPSVTRPALRLFLGVNRNRNSAQLAYWITALPQVHMEAFTVLYVLHALSRAAGRSDGVRQAFP
jgi:hypothetical protein